MTNEQREALEAFLKVDAPAILALADAPHASKSGWPIERVRDMVLAGVRECCGYGVLSDAVIADANLIQSVHRQIAAIRRIAPAIRALLERVEAAESRAAELEDKQVWRCFHCDAEFNNSEEAALHFGKSEVERPACLLDEGGLKALRNAEAELARYRDEDSDVDRQFNAIRGKHATELLREEEKGYARGLKDAKYEGVKWDEDRAALTSRNRQLTEALGELLDRYVTLVNCGDCGNWDPETEEQVIAARAALADALPAQGQKEGKS